jgi:tetratricopeptide (TPR) repeat protein
MAVLTRGVLEASTAAGRGDRRDGVTRGGAPARARRVAEARAVALREAELAVALARRSSQVTHAGLASALLTLAGAREAVGDLTGARRALARAVSITSRRAHGAEVVRIRVEALRRLGDVYRHQARYADARRSLRSALALAESRLGRRDVAVAITLNSVGVLGKYSGNLAVAKRAYDRALSIASERGARGLEATLYHNLGGLLHERRQYRRAEPYAQKAVDLRQQLLGSEHPMVMADLSALAAILDGQRRFAESEPIHRRVLEHFERVDDPYEVAVAANNLGVLCFHTERFREAAAHLTRAVEIKGKLLGTTHPDVALTVYNLGKVRLRLGDRTRAARHLRQALRAFRRALGTSHPETRRCERDLAELTSVATARHGARTRTPK